MSQKRGRRGICPADVAVPDGVNVKPQTPPAHVRVRHSSSTPGQPAASTHPGMPLELALLPVIESAFEPYAYSRARAAGLWQFIPDTGSKFGLPQNWWYDGRRDVTESTRAALDEAQQRISGAVG